MFNEICSPIFEKNKDLDPSKRSVFQLVKTIRKSDIGTIYYKKTHATMKKKNYSVVLVKYLDKTAGWTVTRIYLHYTFKQECFKKKFIIMNQLSQQKRKHFG